MFRNSVDFLERKFPFEISGNFWFCDQPSLARPGKLECRGQAECWRRNQTDRACAVKNCAATPTVAIRSALPFCRKTRGKIRKLGSTSFQGICPKCGASGPKRGSHQGALGRGMDGFRAKPKFHRWQ